MIGHAGIVFGLIFLFSWMVLAAFVALVFGLLLVWAGKSLSDDFKAKFGLPRQVKMRHTLQVVPNLRRIADTATADDAVWQNLAADILTHLSVNELRCIAAQVVTLKLDGFEIERHEGELWVISDSGERSRIIPVHTGWVGIPETTGFPVQVFPSFQECLDHIIEHM
jgi:hypothetical protein